MRRISRTMLMIGMIFAYVSIGVCLLAAISFIITGSLPVMQDVWHKVAEEAKMENPDAFAIIMTSMLITSGVVLIFVAGLSIPTAIVAKKARATEEPTNGILIANIVLGFVCGTYFSVAGGILGIIANKRIERNRRRAGVIDAK